MKLYSWIVIVEEKQDNIFFMENLSFSFFMMMNLFKAAPPPHFMENLF